MATARSIAVLLLPVLSWCACGDSVGVMRWSNCDGDVCGENQHTYEIHQRERVSQTGKHFTVDAGGYTESTASVAQASVRYMRVGNDTGCPPSVQGRTSIVNYECGGSAPGVNVVTKVEEANTCEYTFTIASRACCTTAPSRAPTNSPSTHPSRAPSAAPSRAPSAAPSRAPSAAPTPHPTRAPTDLPTPAPTSGVQKDSCDKDPATFGRIELTSPATGTTLVVNKNVTVSGMNSGTIGASSAIGYVTTQMYTNGAVAAHCATAGIPFGQRETMVQYRCGLAYEIVSVDEVISCQYLLQVRMPNCCTVAELNTLLRNAAAAVTAAPSTAPSQHPTGEPVDVEISLHLHDDLHDDTSDRRALYIVAAVAFFFIACGLQTYVKPGGK